MEEAGLEIRPDDLRFAHVVHRCTRGERVGFFFEALRWSGEPRNLEPWKCAEHIAQDLAIPANLTPRFLPPYSPELNAIERVWLYLRERFLSHRLWPTHDDILDACCAAWNALLAAAGRIRSLSALDWPTVSS